MYLKVWQDMELEDTGSSPLNEDIIKHHKVINKIVLHFL